MQTGRRQPVTFVRGHGCLVYDDSGKEYLDLVAGIAVNLLGHAHPAVASAVARDRKSTRLNSSHPSISYAVFCLKKKKIVQFLTASTFSQTFSFPQKCLWTSLLVK